MTTMRYGWRAPSWFTIISTVAAVIGFVLLLTGPLTVALAIFGVILIVSAVLEWRARRPTHAVPRIAISIEFAFGFIFLASSLAMAI